MTQSSDSGFFWSKPNDRLPELTAKFVLLLKLTNY